MTDTREIEARIHSFEAIGKIILAMKSLSSFNVQQAQESILRIRTYQSQIYHALADFMRLFPSQVPSVQKGRKLLIIFGSDQGLCGQFNQILLQVAETIIRDSEPETGCVLIGRRLQEFFSSLPLLVLHAPSDIREIYTISNEILIFIYQAYQTGRFQQVELLFNRFDGLGSYHPRHLELLPLPRGTHEHTQILVDVAPEILLGSLLSEYFYIELHRALLESFLSENGVRLVNMNQASHNIEQKMMELEGEGHFARQNELTDELNEIMGAYSVVMEGRA